MLLCRCPLRPTRLQSVRTLVLRTLSTQTSGTTQNSPKPYYITTPIFYPNADPHIGHLFSLVVADIFARFQRLLDPKRAVKFVTGTDEHGLKIQKAANELKKEPLEFCDERSVQFRKLSKVAEISNTHFVRTSTLEHRNAVENVWRELDRGGLIYKGTYSGWYSISDECFYTDNQITPVPAPPGEKTRYISTETTSEVQWTEEQNYMFRLSSFSRLLDEHYSLTTVLHPPPYQTYIKGLLALGTVSEPLEDLSISRPRERLKWGIPVPGDKTQTVYVWFDALLSYLSGIGYPWKNTSAATVTETGWPPDIQVIGKDIVRFHALHFPAILMGLNLPLPSRLLTHAHWTVDKRKMSKSVGNVVDPFKIISLYGIDMVRYYLASVGGKFQNDVAWDTDQLTKHSNDIRTHLGNTLLRITSPAILRAVSAYDSVDEREILEQILLTPANAHQVLLLSCKALPERVRVCLDRLDVSDAVREIMDVLRLANKTLTDLAPWTPSAIATKTTHQTHFAVLETLRVVGICLQPFLPNAADRLLIALGVPVEERSWADAEILGGKTQGKKPTAVKLFV